MCILFICFFKKKKNKFLQVIFVSNLAQVRLLQVNKYFWSGSLLLKTSANETGIKDGAEVTTEVEWARGQRLEVTERGRGESGREFTQVPIG